MLTVTPRDSGGRFLHRPLPHGAPVPAQPRPWTDSDPEASWVLAFYSRPLCPPTPGHRISEQRDSLFRTGRIHLKPTELRACPLPWSLA